MENKNNQEITYLEKVALAGEVAFAVSTSLHDADIKFRIYLMAAQIPEHLRPPFISLVKEMVTLPDEELEKVLLEAMENRVPVWLWIEKCIADIKLNLKVQELTGGATLKISCDKREARKAIVMSSFTKFTRQLALCSVEVGIELCREVLRDDELEFLHPITFTLLEEIKDYALTRKKSTVPATIMSITYDCRDILSSILESEAVKILADEPTYQDLQGVSNSVKESKKVSEEVEDLFENPSKKCKVQYIVTKTYNSSNLTTALRYFSSLEEAEEFVNELKDTFPELEKTCKFEIHTEKKSR